MQDVNLSRSVISGVDAHEYAVGVRCIHADLFRTTRPYPSDGHTDMPESRLHEVTDAVRLPGGEDVVRRSFVFDFWLLQHEPHALHVILGVSPVPERVQIAEINTFLQTNMDTRD